MVLKVAIIAPRDEPFVKGRLIIQRELCPYPNAIVVVVHSSGTEDAFTPKELRLIAQGCEGERSRIVTYPNGVPSHGERDATPLGEWRDLLRCPQGSRDARQPLGYETQLLRSKDQKTAKSRAHGSVKTLRARQRNET